MCQVLCQRVKSKPDLWPLQFTTEVAVTVCHQLIYNVPSVSPVHEGGLGGGERHSREGFPGEV